IGNFDTPPHRPCNGDPGGLSVTCHWVGAGYKLRVETPQLYGETDPEGRTAGILEVSRIVDMNAPHLEWVKPGRVADTFLNSVSRDRVKRAEQNLASMKKWGIWYQPDLRDSPFLEAVMATISKDLEATTMEGPERARFIPLFCDEKRRIFVAEAEGP